MNWDTISFDWNQVRAFMATADQGSLSAAARVLGQTQPTIGRQVAGLEDTLGIALFERIGRGLVLTPSGRAVLEHVHKMAEAAVQISLVAAGQTQGIEGKVRITASDVFAAYVLPPMLQHLRSIAPRLEVEIIAANDIRDIQRREADIAIRHVRPAQPELYARLVNEAEAHLYAAASYLSRRGRPLDKADLSQHDFINFGSTDEMIGYLTPLGIHVTAQNFHLGSNSGVVAWEYVQRGLGIAFMSADIGDTTPGIERVLPDMPPVVFPVWLITHRDLHTSPRIRLIFDTLAEFLSRPPEK
ncbi:LysR family transcriptional regulator [Aliiroseovarius sp. S2029]|uniref:LysR family transcriptional regulator n=1 Tax=Aliiroseovarius sp. S2029 TaxID=2936988 RepID=UPI0020BF9E89|nr:LysR family transcriptional regulator [Aliiroseovarius sp. S2029]MCK8484646.1 LysR family transcriptional regulator [Aliiroseovarius sp. S2029]